MRKLFGKPIRKSTTAAFYPRKMKLDNFVKMCQDADAFANNMKALGQDEDNYVEIWFETFMAWCEVEQGFRGDHV